MKLSIIVPSIRPRNIIALYGSVDLLEKDFEIIIIGPSMSSFRPPNLKFIESYRSPNACQQQGLMAATGDYITFAADDGVFLLGALENAFDYLIFSSNSDLIDYKTIIVSKYLEGDSPHPHMYEKEYYKFGYHKAYRLKGVPQGNYIFNAGLISRKFMLELGGWDCQFEATTCAHADLGIRASQAGANMVLMHEPLFKCSHQPGKTGDHGPIDVAMQRDLKTFKKLYSKPRQTRIDLDNWKKTPEVWKTRFGS